MTIVIRFPLNNVDKMLMRQVWRGHRCRQAAHRAAQVSLSQRIAPSSHLDDGNQIASNSKRATSGAGHTVGPDVALLPAGQNRLAKKAPTLSRGTQ